MTLNGVIALILLYFTGFDSFAGLLRHSGWRYTYIVCRISSSTFGHKWPTVLCDSWDTCATCLGRLLTSQMLTRCPSWLYYTLEWIRRVNTALHHARHPL